jgi:tartrate-resistant acid phosphatase type 5
MLIRRGILTLVVCLAVAATADTTPWCNTYTVGNMTVLLPPPPSLRLRLVVIGDAGEAWAASQCGKPVCPPPPFPPAELAAAIRKATADRAADAILVLGDNIYPCGVTDKTVDVAMKTVYQPLFDLKTPMYALLGNHDYSEGGIKCTEKEHAEVKPQKQVDYKGGTWKMPARNYVLRWPGLATIVMFDSEPIRRKCGPRQNIIDFVKRNVAEIGSGEWRLAAAHHSLFSSGEHGQNPDDAGTMRTALWSTFDRKLDLYISGHDHDLERFGNATNPVYVVSGSASLVRAADVKPAPPTFFATYGFAVVDLSFTGGQVRLYDGKEGKYVLTTTLTR